MPIGELPSCLLLSQFSKSMDKARLDERNQSQVLFCLSAFKFSKLLGFKERVAGVVRMSCVICLLLWLSLDCDVTIRFGAVKTVA